MPKMVMEICVQVNEKVQELFFRFLVGTLLWTGCGKIWCQSALPFGYAVPLLGLNLSELIVDTNFLTFHVTVSPTELVPKLWKYVK